MCIRDSEHSEHRLDSCFNTGLFESRMSCPHPPPHRQTAKSKWKNTEHARGQEPNNQIMISSLFGPTCKSSDLVEPGRSRAGWKGGVCVWKRTRKVGCDAGEWELGLVMKEERSSERSPSISNISNRLLFSPRCIENCYDILFAKIS